MFRKRLKNVLLKHSKNVQNLPQKYVLNFFSQNLQITNLKRF